MRFLSLNKTERKTCEKSAQRIVRSVMNLRVRAGNATYGKNVNLRVDDVTSSDSVREFHSWTQNIPSLLQLHLEDQRYTRQLYHPPDDTFVHRPEINSRLEEEEVKNETFYEVANIIKWYPELSDAMDFARDRCTCGCKEVLSQIRLGCLQSAVYAEVLLIVGHAMAEAAGAVDISNLAGSRLSRALVVATARLLGDIAHGGIIWWSTWFRLAATAITGTPNPIGDEHSKQGRGEVLCAIAGSMTVVPAWLVFDEDITIEGSWTVKTLVGVPFGIMTERAILLARSTNFATPQDVPEIEFCSTASDSAREEVKVESAVMGTSNELYYLMTLVSTSKALRCVSPIDVYLGAIHAIRPRCSHGSSPREVHPWTMSFILQSWNRNPDRITAAYPAHAHIACTGSSIVNRNFGAALAGEGCILQTSACCFGCLVDTALKERRLAVAFEGQALKMRPLLGFP
jgi:hypothetical protein